MSNFSPPYLILAISQSDHERLVQGDTSNIAVLHMVVYAEQPDEHSFQHLYEELNTDPEFDLVGVPIQLWQAPDSVRDNLLTAEEQAMHLELLKPDNNLEPGPTLH